MKALTLTAPNVLEYGEVPDPTPGPDEVLIRVRAAGICGSDVHGMDGSSGRRIPPLIMGHEASGDIEAVGSNVRGWKRADRVTFDSTVYRLDDWYTLKGQYNLSDGREVLGVSAPEFKRNGAFAEFIAVPSHILVALPDEVSYEHAAMVEPAAVAFHALSLADIALGDSAVVVGTGMVGLFVVQALKLAGCARIIAVDINEDRLQTAATLGATHTISGKDPDLLEKITDLCDGRGADLAVEVVGSEQTMNTAIGSVRRGATVIAVGNLSLEGRLPLQAIVTRQIRIQGSCAICGEFSKVLSLLAAGRLEMEALLTARAALSEGAGWFGRLKAGEPGLMKVVLIP